MGNFDVMGGKNEGGFLAVLNVQHQVEYFSAVFVVQICGRLIGEDQLRFFYQGPRYRNTLALSSAEFIGEFIPVVDQSHFFQSFKHKFMAFPVRGFIEKQGILYVFIG